MFYGLPPVFRNAFFLTGLAFVIWMLFFDENNMLVQLKRRQKLVALQTNRSFYIHEIERVNRQFNELSSNSLTQEKFARENYMMKKDDEDVFVIVSK